MNGAGHYAEAERLLDVAGSPAGVALKLDGYDALAAAQVHATLAAAAATIENAWAVAGGHPPDDAWAVSLR